MKFIPRSGWLAREPTSQTSMTVEDLQGVAVHYTGMNADEQALHENCSGRVRAIQNFHMDEQSWADIAYNFLVCKHGFVFEGRGWKVRPAAQGTAFGNNRYHAVCFLGDDTPDRDDVTRPGRVGLAQLVFRAVELYPHAYRVKPHSAFTSTSCPGDQLRAWIESIRDTIG